MDEEEAKEKLEMFFLILQDMLERIRILEEQVQKLQGLGGL